VPTWADTFLPACAFIKADETFGPQSRAPGAAGSSTKTLTIGFYEDGRFKVLAGCMGTFVMRLPAGGNAQIEWTFTGVWVAPTDVAILAPDYPAVAPLRFGGGTFTVDEYEFMVSELTIDAGQEVTLRQDATNIAGYISAIVTGRRIVGAMDAEAKLVATKDAYGEWLARTEQALVIQLNNGAGSANGNIIDVAAPKLQITNITNGDREGLRLDNIEFQLNRSLDAGDDELTITFS